MSKSKNLSGLFWLDLFQSSVDPSSEQEDNEDDSKPLAEYLLPKFKLNVDELSLKLMKNTVQFLNLKKCYEKVQKRRDGVSTQRPMNCNIQMIARFAPTWGARDIDVFVQRQCDSARLCGDLNGRTKLEITVREKTLNTVSFSVDLDSVYRTNSKTQVYKLSTVDPLRRNKFVLIIRFSSTELNRYQYFTSPAFLIRSRRPLKTADCTTPTEKPKK